MISIPLGTRSLLFGVHQLVLHPLFVIRAWRLVYGIWPTLSEALAIFLHDVGYCGKKTMDGPDGQLHPELGAAILRQLLGRRGEHFADMVLYHSRTYAKRHDQPVSRIGIPDKLSILLYGDALYLLLARLSGEIHEYKSQMGYDGRSDQAWLTFTKASAYNWALSYADPQVRARITEVFPRGDTVHRGSSIERESKRPRRASLGR